MYTEKDAPAYIIEYEDGTTTDPLTMSGVLAFLRTFGVTGGATEALAEQVAEFRAEVSGAESGDIWDFSPGKPCKGPFTVTMI